MARSHRRQQPGAQWPSRRPTLGPREVQGLFDAVTDYRTRPERVFHEVLVTALPTWAAFAQEYEDYRRFASAPPFTRSADPPWPDLWTFYGLSRLFEWLTIGVQDRAHLGRDEPSWPAVGTHPVLGSADLVHFFGALGMEPMHEEPVFHPFLHEVVAAQPDSTLGDAVIVEEEIWPGLWFGDLVFARAGVRVRHGPGAHFDPVLAARTTLYFAWQRVHRPTTDLSDGWGSGSQWATAMRRDYVDGAWLRYNVDGSVRLTDDTIVLPPPSLHRGDDAALCGDLTPAERVELVRHRCFVRTKKPDEGRWPFDDTYVEDKPEWFATP